MKKIAILQSNYIPWKGYFDLIDQVDEFVFYDDVQYTKQDWRNRNKIKTPQGTQWLTIPVSHKSMEQLIQDTKITDSRWSKKHWKTIVQNYSKAEYFNDYKDQLEALYQESTSMYLSEVNFELITEINKILGITTKLKWSRDFDLVDGQTERLISICKDCNADTYISGPAAQSYFDEELAQQEKINVEWMAYNNYKEYKQLNPPFDHYVTILDLIFNEGPNSINFFKG